MTWTLPTSSQLSSQIFPASTESPSCLLTSLQLPLMFPLSERPTDLLTSIVCLGNSFLPLRLFCEAFSHLDPAQDLRKIDAQSLRETLPSSSSSLIVQGWLILHQPPQGSLPWLFSFAQPTQISNFPGFLCDLNPYHISEHFCFNNHHKFEEMPKSLTKSSSSRNLSWGNNQKGWSEVYVHRHSLHCFS